MQSRHSYSLIMLASLVLSACASFNPFQSDGPPTSEPVEQTDADLQDQPIETSSAVAEPTPPDAPVAAPPPLTPAEIAALTWKITSDGNGLQHLASGYICPVALNDFALTGDQSFPELGQGNDVACIYEAAEGGAVKLHLTNFGREVSTSAHLKGVKTSIVTANHDTTTEADLPIAPGAVTPENAAAYQISAVSNLRPETPVHSAVWIERIGSWHVKARATYETDRSQQIAVLVSALFAIAQRDIPASPQTDPPQR